MSVPPYTEFMLPILQIMSDGKQRSPREMAELAADRLGLSIEDRELIFPASLSLIYKNRSAWAVEFLSKSGVLAKIAHGQYTISQRGRDLIAENPTRVDTEILMRYPEFVQWVKGGTEDKKAKNFAEQSQLSVEAVSDALTPQDQIKNAFQLYEGKVIEDLLDRLGTMNPARFERLVLDLLVKMGYGGLREDAGQVIGGPGDGGVDAVIKEDRLGLDVIYIQAKRWQESVNGDRVMAFKGSVLDRGAHKGVLITTSKFTKSAKESAQKTANPKIILIDGAELSRLCIEFGIGVRTVEEYQLKAVDADFFDEQE